MRLFWGYKLPSAPAKIEIFQAVVVQIGIPPASPSFAPDQMHDHELLLARHVPRAWMISIRPEGRPAAGSFVEKSDFANLSPQPFVITAWTPSLPFTV